MRPGTGREAGLGHAQERSITYRIAVGPQQGRKVFTLQTLPDESDSLSSSSVAETAGFSLPQGTLSPRSGSHLVHAGVATKANERAKLERLCRYITRPAISMKRLSLTKNGQVRYELKTPWRNGTTHVLFEPLDFTAPAHPCARGISASMHIISRLVSLIPKPRVNLTRFHGIFAPNSKYRALVTPAQRGKGNKVKIPKGTQDQTPAEKRASMTGFCSCKTGIHAIPGNNVGKAVEAGF